MSLLYVTLPEDITKEYKQKGGDTMDTENKHPEEEPMTEEELKSRYIAPQMTPEQKRSQEEMVQFKLGLILPAVYHTHDYASDAQYFKALSMKTLLLPNGNQQCISVKTLERWKRNFLIEEAKPDGYGKNALITKERSDKGKSRILRLGTMMEIVYMLREVPTMKATKILDRLITNEIIGEGSCSADTIRRFIIAYDLRSKEAIEYRIRRSFVYPEFGQLWEADTCYLTKIPVPGEDKLQWVYIQGIIDDHSRKMLALNCYMNDNVENFIQTFKTAILQYGIPTMLYVDNGAVYIASWLYSACNNLGIKLIHTRSNDGASKAVIERAWFSLEIDVIPTIVLDRLDKLDEIQKVVDDWRERYNASLNQGVNGIPNERHAASLKRHPVRLPKSEEWLEDCMMFEEYCHVYNDNTVQKNNVRYELPDEIVGKVRKGSGKTLLIRYEPGNVQGTIHTVVGEKKYYLTMQDREANAHRKRNTGGRKAQLEEQQEEKKKKSLAEVRAEERLERRLPGIDLEELYGLKEPDKKGNGSGNNEDADTTQKENKSEEKEPKSETVPATPAKEVVPELDLDLDYSLLFD